MNLSEFTRIVGEIPFGKRLPLALYVYKEEGVSLGGEIDSLLHRVTQTYQLDATYNVVKFRLDELKLSLLSYPDFLEVPHPALRQAVTIDLRTGRARHADYAHNANPPILHRKETFLRANHPRRAKFEALTRAEEKAGLYEETATIGFKLNWDKLLAKKGISIRGHKLRKVEKPVMKNERPPPFIERHKTALTRYELSKPVKNLLEHGILKQTSTFFDFGCGQGSDMRGLQALGYQATGWDPVYRPDTAKPEADIVNLGYVLNVIEDPAERLDTLVNAYRYARRLLVVSALINETVEKRSGTQYRDGVLTQRNTFQKYYDQQELQQYIEDALDTTAVPVALGIFYVFRDPTEQQDFLSARSRRTIDWTQVSARLGLGRPRKSRWEVLYEQHKELLDAFWALNLQLGRRPAPEEFPRFGDLCETIGSPKRAVRLFVQRGGANEMARAAEIRSNDLLVYLAMSNLRKRVPWGHLSPSLRLDIRHLFGNHRRALEKGLELLYTSGDPGEIELACENLNIGWQDEQALYFHRSLLEHLPPVLRAYVGCAAALFGDVQQADLVKLHRASGKVTFLVYDDFENKPLPELQQRIKVNLRTRWVQVFDHSAEGQFLYYKERYLLRDHPANPVMQEFSAKLHKLGISEQVFFGPNRGEFAALLEHHGLNENLNKRRPRNPRDQSSELIIPTIFSHGGFDVA